MLRAQLAAADGDVSTIDPSEEPQVETLRESVRRFFREEAPWWGCSFALHAVLLSTVALLAGVIPVPARQQEVVFNAAQPPMADEPPDIDPPTKDVPPDPPIVPVERDVVTTSTWESVDRIKPDKIGTPDGNDQPPITPVTTSLGKPGDLGGPDTWALGSGPARPGIGRIGGVGMPGPGGPKENPYRGRVSRVILPRLQKRIDLALSWLARHQMPDGSWSLDGYTARCSDKTCSGAGGTHADSAATSLALLPFLAAGHTHRVRDEYQKVVANGLAWLVRQQKPDGDLRCGATMYAHGLATITLCEAAGMTGDRSLAYAAQNAVSFLEAAQNKRTGGWRYQPGEEGDLSVTGWQVMALKSAQMAGLSVDAGALERAREYVRAASAGQGGSAASSGARGQFAYQPGGRSSRTMTSVGLLCSQYLGAGRHDPMMTEGTAALMANLPDASQRDLYFWYYATQVMHNQPGPDWDVWNRKIRNLLVESQDLNGCAKGSWDPRRPTPDPWGAQGGRLMTTSLATLTLEVYYRYIPLYKLDAPEAGAGEGGGK